MVVYVLFRLGHHSTSDDSSAYRSTDEVGQWQEQDPILKLEKYMKRKGWITDEEKADLEKTSRKEVLVYSSYYWILRTIIYII